MHSARRVVEDAATDRPESRAERGGESTVASRVDGLKVLADALGQLPVTLRFWDDSAVVARNDPDAPVVLIRDERAIAHVLRAPNQLGLGRAWVSGVLDVDGDLERVLGLRHGIGGLSYGPLRRLRLAAAALRVAGPRACAGRRRRNARPSRPGGCTRCAATVPRSAITTTSRTRSTGCCSARAWSTPARTSRYAGATRSTRAQERKLDLICRKLRLAPGERLLDIGCGWGVAGHPRRRAPRRARARRDAVASRRPSSRASGSRRAGLCRPRRGRACSTTASSTSGRFDKIAERRHVRARRPRAARHLRRRGAQRCCVPAGSFLNHGITRTAARAAARPATFIDRYVFPDGELHPVTDVIGALRGRAASRSATSSRCASITRSPCGAGSPTCATRRDAAVAEIGDERERVWRLYMLGSAQGFEVGEIGIYQTLAARPGAPHALPLDRSDLLL